MERIIGSLLDNDLYKFTMGQSVFRHYDNIEARYKFINRGQTRFPDGFADRLREQIVKMSDLRLAENERAFLLKKCYFLRAGYIDWLSHYRYEPNEIEIVQDDGELSVEIKGPWYRTIYWEVPLMATICELYFVMTNQKPDPYWENRVRAKGETLRQARVNFADFGTRRRYSYSVHEKVLANLISSAKTSDTGGVLVGTSNLALANKFDLTPIGTFAHEWVMAHAGMFGNRMATRMALEAWMDEFDASLGIALSDTFTTDVFLESFDLRFAKLFDGVRQDSGDPIIFTQKIISHYEKLRIDPMSKTIVFSDGLDTPRALSIAKFCKGKVKCSFGIGTNLTNDVGVKPLNIVVKLHKIGIKGRDIPVVKLSDSSGKETGDIEAIRMAKYDLGIS